jgi:hypothetical protein
MRMMKEVRCKDHFVERGSRFGRFIACPLYLLLYLCANIRWGEEEPDRYAKYNNRKDMKELIMKRVIILGTLCVMMLIGSAAFAQSTVVKGIVQDSITHQGEPYASVRVFKRGMAQPAAMFVTDVQGAFHSAIKGTGSYELVVSAVGRKDIHRPFTLRGESTLDLGILYVADNVQVLKNVTVTAQKPLVKMAVDKMSYSVENDVDAKTNTVLEMLRKVPMVTVDGQDNITVNGSSNFKIYVDGKPSVMFNSNPSLIFKNMPASAVKDIEVVTNPGAKYDAEGVGGVLNLVMNHVAGQKADMNSASATLRTMVSNRGVGGGVFAAVQQGKLGITVNANVGNNKMNGSEMSVERDQTTASSLSKMVMNQNGDTKYGFRMGNMSMSYAIDSLRLLSASFGLMGFENKVDGTSHSTFTGAAYGSGYGYSTVNDNKGSRYGINGSIDYQRSFAGHPGRTFTISYLLSSSPDHSKVLSSFSSDASGSVFNLSDRYSNVRNNTLEQTAQMDYSTPLSKTTTLDMGLKYINRNNRSHSYYYNVSGDDRTFDTSNSSNYKHDNDIFAAYAEMGTIWNKVSAKAGLRYEYTWQHVKYLLGQGENFSTNYGNLVPSASLSYKISDSQNIGLAYNMRISRPGITMLNPYVDKSDPSALSYGNTSLDCERAHNINLVYNYFSMKLMMNLTLRESLCNNEMAQYSFYENNILHTTYGNIIRDHNTGLTAFVNWNVATTTRIVLNGGVSYVDLHSSRLGLSNSGWQANAMLSLQQTLPGKIKMSLNMMSSTKRYNLQGWSTGFKFAACTLSRSFFDDRLNVSVSGMTPLDSSKMNFKSFAKGSDYVTYSSNRLPMRAAIFSVSYTFGGKRNASQQQKVQHTIKNDDLKNVQHQGEEMQQMMMN